MTIPILRTSMILAGLLSLVLTQHLSAQDRKSDEDATWYDVLKDQRSEVKPQNLKLLSIQVSKLPRDTFGHGKPPGDNSFVSSFVAASGTGVYGVFELDVQGELKYREELSSLETFTDDRGTDLTENPDEEEINEFFDSNKKLSVKLSSDQSKAVFTVRGYSTPQAGAKSVNAEASITFLSLSQEKSATVKTKLFGTSDKIEVGPVAFRVAKNSGQTVFRTGRTRWSGNDKKDWALLMDARQKPVKRIEVLDAEGNIVWKTTGMAFNGKKYTQYMEQPEAEPAAVRVTWYEKWQLITVPLKIETPLGI